MAAKPTNIFFTVLSLPEQDDSNMRDMVSGENFPVRTNRCYFFPINHSVYWNLSPSVRFISLHFNLEFFYGLDLFQNYPECLSWDAPEATEELRSLFQHDRPLTALFRVNALLYRLCIRLMERHPVAAPDMVHWLRYSEVIAYVRKHCDAATRVEDLADLMGMRSNVFSRNFTRDLGITPKTFLVNALLRKATTLLQLPDAGVRTTAEKLRFSSEYYFSTFFKKHFGISPRTFQLQNRLDGPQAETAPDLSGKLAADRQDH